MRNGLYEINAFNKNLFAFAGSLGVGNTPLNPLSTKSDIHVKMTDPQGYLNSTNIFGISNVNSYYWVTDVTNHQHAVPNYLTGRQINGKIVVEL